MSIGLRLDLRQTQQLVMTPQLQQAIKLLQMSNIELADFVEREIEKNPLLTVDSGESQADPAQPDVSAVEAADTAPAAADTVTGDDTVSEEGFSPDPDLPPSPTDRLPYERGSTTMASYEGMQGLEERVAEKPSLREHLRAQIGQMRADPVTLSVARYLVEELDEHGYLRSAPDEIVERLGSDPGTVLEALRLLQSCDPTGVGALDLADCLRLQLAEKDLLDGPMDALLENLELVARGEIRRLKLACSASEDRIHEMTRLLRQLDPRPCSGFDTVEPQTLIPDILLRKTAWGGWHIELNPDTLPKVLIERTYAAEIGSNKCAEARQFLSDCQSNASWLIKSLDQRAKTIVTIASEIVRRQEQFFHQGISGLAPLTLKDVADAVGMHESTASRVTSNKYIETERGTFELKFFFTNAVGDGDGAVAAEAIRHRIKAMVDAESCDAILSDDSIVEALKSEKIDVARRTVAKYRKSLNIPSSVERRRRKSMGRLG